MRKEIEVLLAVTRQADGSLVMYLCGQDMTFESIDVLKEELSRGEEVVHTTTLTLKLNEQAQQMWEIVHKVDLAIDEVDPTLTGLFTIFALAGFNLGRQSKT